jgi:CubicO group peptidase (beta-lactamase class C family)
MRAHGVSKVHAAFSVDDRPPRRLCFGQDASADERFRLWSLSKPICAAVVHALAYDGIVSLEAPLGGVLADLLPGDRRAWGEALTLQRLLQHEAGLANQHPLAVPTHEPLPDLAGVLRGDHGEAHRLRFLRQPGELTEYAGIGYAVVQLAVQRLTGQSFAALARRSLLEPAGIRAAYESELQPGEIAGPFRPTSDAASGLIADAGTYAELMRHILRQPWATQLHDGRKTGLPGRGFCLGLYEDWHFGGRCLTHAGIHDGFHGMLLVNPKARIVSVIWGNDRQAQHVAGPLHGLARSLGMARLGELAPL